MKIALDHVSAGWNNKVAGFVGYRSMSGARAVEHLRGIMAKLQMADVRAQVGLSLFIDFENFSEFKSVPHHEGSVNTMFDQIVAWAGTLKTLR